MKQSRPEDVFPVRLRAARERRELSQAELAQRCGLLPSAVSHFETGTRKPSFANLRKLAEALQVSTDYLLGRVEDMSGSAGVDLLFRKLENLSAHEREVIAGLADQFAAKKKGREDGE